MSTRLESAIRGLLTKFQFLDGLDQELQSRVLQLAELMPLSEDWEQDLINHPFVVREAAMLKAIFNRLKAKQEHVTELAWSTAVMNARDSLKASEGSKSYKPTLEEIRSIASHDDVWQKEKDRLIELESVFEFLLVIEKNLYSRLQAVKLLQQWEGEEYN